MKKSATTKGESPSRLIDARIKERDDWRGKTLSHVRALIKQADPELVEEWKWTCGRGRGGGVRAAARGRKHRPAARRRPLSRSCRAADCAPAATGQTRAKAEAAGELSALSPQSRNF